MSCVWVVADMSRPMRADARRNRERLLAVAVEMLSASGAAGRGGTGGGDEEVPLEAIARRAGVGIGTLYRHFPSRAALIEEAYRHEVHRLCDAAAELAATMAPDVALREWMDRFVGYIITKRGMANALQSVVSSDSDLFAETYRQIVTALATLLNAGAGAGTIREDTEAEDVLRALRGVWMVADSPDAREQADRLLDLLMDGLRYGAKRPAG